MGFRMNAGSTALHRSADRRVFGNAKNLWAADQGTGSIARLLAVVHFGGPS